MDHHMNLEERVVAAEVASRRADGPGAIEVQSQRPANLYLYVPNRLLDRANFYPILC